jgi:hypothetical protein
MQEHVKCNTAKDVGDYLDLRTKNSSVLMMEFPVVVNSADMVEM